MTRQPRRGTVLLLAGVGALALATGVAGLAGMGPLSGILPQRQPAPPEPVAECEVTAVSVGGGARHLVAWVPAGTSEDRDDARYVVERRVAGADAWSWRHRSEAGTTAWTDVEPGRSEPLAVEYRVRTRSVSGALSAPVGCSGGLTLPAPSEPGCPAGAGTATGRWHTEEICGLWQVVGPGGSVRQWRAVNVRADQLAAHPLDATDVAALAEVFDTVRLTLRWDQLQPGGPQSLDPAWAIRVRGVLNALRAQGVGVVLDIAHLGGGGRGSAAFSIPSWAWDTTGIAPADRRPSTSYAAWAGPENTGLNLASYVDALHASGLLTHPAVIAVEVVNEPNPPPGSRATDAAAQQRLAEVYHELVTHIRTKDPGMMVVLGAYYGGTRHGGARVGEGFAFNHAATVLDQPNLVWTAHSYFTGVGDDDGQADDGGRGVGTWAEEHASAGCYGEPEHAARSTAWSCPPEPRDRDGARAALVRNVRGHWDYAQQAQMPFFLGEWGVGRRRYQVAEYRGWGLAEFLACDRLAALDDVDGEGTATSWAVWSFDAGNDAFGLYLARDAPTLDEPHRSYLAPNAWVDSGTFGVESRAWQGLSWTYAEPFTDPSLCATLDEPSP